MYIGIRKKLYERQREREALAEAQRAFSNDGITEPTKEQLAKQLGTTQENVGVLLREQYQAAHPASFSGNITTNVDKEGNRIGNIGDINPQASNIYAQKNLLKDAAEGKVRVYNEQGQQYTKIDIVNAQNQLNQLENLRKEYKIPSKNVNEIYSKIKQRQESQAAAQTQRAAEQTPNTILNPEQKATRYYQTGEFDVYGQTYKVLQPEKKPYQPTPDGLISESRPMSRAVLTKKTFEQKKAEAEFNKKAIPFFIASSVVAATQTKNIIASFGSGAAYGALERALPKAVVKRVLTPVATTAFLGVEAKNYQSAIARKGGFGAIEETAMLLPNMLSFMVGRGITAPKPEIKTQAEKLTKQYEGKPTTALIKDKPLIERPEYMNLRVYYKPLQNIEGLQVVRDNLVFESIRPKYAKQKASMTYAEMLSQPKDYIISVEGSGVQRVVAAPPSKPTTLPTAKASLFQGDISYKVGLLADRGQIADLLEPGLKSRARVYRAGQEEGISNIRRWVNVRANIEPIELSNSRDIMQQGAREQPKGRKWTALDFQEPSRQITYIPKLTGRKFLFTESGELIGAIKYNGVIEKYFPAPKELKTKIKSSLGIITAIKPTRAAPRAKPIMPIIERETGQGQILLQKVITKQQTKQKTQTLQKTKVEQISKQRQETKQVQRQILKDVEADVLTLSKNRFESVSELVGRKSKSSSRVALAAMLSLKQSQAQKAAQAQAQSQLLSQSQTQGQSQSIMQSLGLLQSQSQLQSQSVSQSQLLSQAQSILETAKLQRQRELIRMPPKPQRKPDGNKAKTRKKIFELREKIKRGYLALIKRKGKFLKVSPSVSREAALDIGAGVAARTLGATFKIIPSGEKPLDIKPTGEFQRLREMFRDYKIRKGLKVALQDEFIQKRGTRLGRKEEVEEILKAKRSRAISIMKAKANKKKRKVFSMFARKKTKGVGWL